MNPSGVFSSGISAVTPTVQGGLVSTAPGTPYLPAYWNGSASSWVSLGTGAANEAGAVNGVLGDTEAGFLFVNSVQRASLWHGSAVSRIDLHPAGALSSIARAIAGDEQAGDVTFPDGTGGAAIWHGSAASYLNLNPVGYAGSSAQATNGNQQAGFAIQVTNGPQHAALWSGTAASFVDLNPFGPASGDSVIEGMAAGQQVGYATGPSFQPHVHGFLWSGTAASAVDLNPFPGLDSELYATSGGAQVGRSSAPGSPFPHAGIWFGSASSFLDLHSFLPAGYYSSVATSVSVTPDGHIYVGGNATRSGGSNEAFMWVFAPSPGVVPIVAFGGLFAVRRRR
jgi:hypothetical protein